MKCLSVFFSSFPVHSGLLGNAEYNSGTGKYLGRCYELEHFGLLQIFRSKLI